MMKSNIRKIILVAILAIAASGCKTTEPQYYYGQYSNAVYSYFKADEVTVEEQISILEEVIQTAAANSKYVAPGIHAHLGMLYFEVGNHQLGAQHFEQEKALFPESTHYINFLLKPLRGLKNVSS